LKHHLDGYEGDEIRAVVDFLLRVGGKSGNGFPNYRLVESDRVFETKGAIWHDWDETLTASERAPRIRKVIPVRERIPVPTAIQFHVPSSQDGGIEVVVQKSVLLPGHKPIRVVPELRLVPKYCELDPAGWILQKYYPAAMFGSPDAWYSRTVKGTSIPLLGPYPERGQYEMIAGVFRMAPSFDFLDRTIQYHQKRAREKQETDVTAYVNEAFHRHNKAEENKRNELAAQLRDMMSPLLSNTEAAGRWRNRIAEEAGIRSHMGN
jgi:hypothetical protein